MTVLKNKSKIIKLIKLSYKINNNEYSLVQLTNFLILLNLKVEILLFKKIKKDLLKQKIDQELLNFEENLKNLILSQQFLKKKITKKIIFKKEEQHKILFNKLWSLFNLEEYKNDRIQRYIKRIKINNLVKHIKGKKIIDFGCGHGNFLIACYMLGAKECVGIDYGKDSINFAQNICRKLKIPKNSVKFLKTEVYNSHQKNEYFDFAIQNGVFHHLQYEKKAYLEVKRVLKPNGYFWVYTDGGGGVRDQIHYLSQRILKRFDKSLITEFISRFGLTTSKQYHLGDSMNAHYNTTTYKTIERKLAKINFIKSQYLKGGFKTDFDKMFSNDPAFDFKFGDGQIRILFRKLKK